MAASVPLAGVALLLFFFLLQAAHGGSTAGLAGGARMRPSSSSSLEGYVPVRTVVYRPSSAAAAAETAQAYEPFELCMECRCCPSGAGAGAGAGSNSPSCVDTSCCYGIDCNIPGKPFGTCAFTPRTCGCGDAAAGSNCTSAPAPPS